MDQNCANDKTKRHEAEQRNAFFDHAERALPHHEPDQECGRNGPPLKINSRGELERNADATNFRRQHEQSHECEYEVEKREVVETKTFANRVWNRAAANG